MKNRFDMPFGQSARRFLSRGLILSNEVWSVL